MCLLATRVGGHGVPWLDLMGMPDGGFSLTDAPACTQALFGKQRRINTYRSGPLRVVLLRVRALARAKTKAKYKKDIGTDRIGIFKLFSLI